MVNSINFVLHFSTKFSLISTDLATQQSNDRRVITCYFYIAKSTQSTTYVKNIIYYFYLSERVVE